MPFVTRLQIGGQRNDSSSSLGAFRHVIGGYCRLGHGQANGGEIMNRRNWLGAVLSLPLLRWLPWAPDSPSPKWETVFDATPRSHGIPCESTEYFRVELLYLVADRYGCTPADLENLTIEQLYLLTTKE